MCRPIFLYLAPVPEINLASARCDFKASNCSSELSLSTHLTSGVLIFLTQIVWIPFLAAGVINGIGHFWGYRNWPTEDASTNMLPWGIVIGGEELHNNHHAFTTSAKLSNKWYEFDLGWMYIRMLETVGLARVNRVAPVPRFAAPRPIPDLQTLHAVITHRYHVMAQY